MLLAVVPVSAFAFDPLDDMLAGRSAMQGKKLAKAIERAAAHPLGSAENPVRTEMPQGQRAYLARLRCADGKAPKFFREGNFGIGVYDNIVDGYRVTCEGSEPASSLIYMDMYHGGHVETAAVPGFVIMPLPTGDQPDPNATSSASTSASSM
jgi:hypothetical protein